MSRVDVLGSLLLKEISRIIMFELNDPKIGFVTVGEVKVSPDLAHARVYVSFLGKGYMKRDGLEALKRSKGRIKSLLAKSLKMRKIPDLEFVADDSLDKAMRIDEIISRNASKEAESEEE